MDTDSIIVSVLFTHTRYTLLSVFFYSPSPLPLIVPLSISMLMRILERYLVCCISLVSILSPCLFVSFHALHLIITISMLRGGWIYMPIFVYSKAVVVSFSMIYDTFFFILHVRVSYKTQMYNLSELICEVYFFSVLSDESRSSAKMPV